MTDLSSIRQKLEKSRRDVLDLSLRNPLLNFRPSKRWTCPAFTDGWFCGRIILP